MSIEDIIDKAVKAKTRYFVTSKILHSVLVQESDLCSTFLKTDRQYKQNMLTAIKLTGKTEEELLKLVTLANGKIAKFRIETSYFNKKEYKLLPFETRFYLSISTGLGQKMGALLVGKPYTNIKSTILGFAGNEPLQALYAAGDMEAGMKRAYLSPLVAKKDTKTLVYHGYGCYNGGSIIPKKAEVIKRCQEVISRL